MPIQVIEPDPPLTHIAPYCRLILHLIALAEQQSKHYQNTFVSVISPPIWLDVAPLLAQPFDPTCIQPINDQGAPLVQNHLPIDR